MHEAEIEETDTGRRPADDGWFILNLAEIGWETVPGGGTWCVFESPATPSKTLGIGVHVLPPGETPGYYHAESEQEGFLVLSGECLAIVEGQERRMGPGDYLHCPPGTAHITIGAGDEPCAIFMVGTRSPGATTQYLPEPAAARHGAAVAVAVATASAREAYAERPPIVPASSSWPLRADDTELHARMDAFQLCIEERDQQAADGLLHEDYALMLLHPAPAVMPRSRWLEVLPEYVVHAYELHERSTDLDGDCASVLQRVTMHATVLGEDRSGTFVISDVWRRGSSGWRIWRRHSTPAPGGGHAGSLSNPRGADRYSPPTPWPTR